MPKKEKEEPDYKQSSSKTRERLADISGLKMQDPDCERHCQPCQPVCESCCPPCQCVCPKPESTCPPPQQEPVCQPTTQRVVEQSSSFEQKHPSKEGECHFKSC
ncbi:hypothetical protein P9112_005997 [Eukaryota sp. TZLM1-RC]